MLTYLNLLQNLHLTHDDPLSRCITGINHIPPNSLLYHLP